MSPLLVFYPEGIESLSPGLRGTSYPGVGHQKELSTLKGLKPGRLRASRSPSCDARQPFQSCAANGPAPRVARASQPWAEDAIPLGLGTAAASRH